MFCNLSFLDHTKTAVVPSALTYRVDDLTNAIGMIPTTSVTPTGSSMIYQIPGAKWTMSYPYEGSQICQIYWSFTATDSVTGAPFIGNSVSIVELVAIQTPN